MKTVIDVSFEINLSCLSKEGIGVSLVQIGRYICRYLGHPHLPQRGAMFGQNRKFYK